MTDVDYTQTEFVKVDALGKIGSVISAPAHMIAVQPLAPGWSIVLGKADMDKDYVLNGAITPRPANPATLSGMKLLNVPNPSSVTIDGENAQQVTDGEVDFEFTQPGTYTVVVSSWPALDATFKVIQT